MRIRESFVRGLKYTLCVGTVFAYTGVAQAQQFFVNDDGTISQSGSSDFSNHSRTSQSSSVNYSTQGASSTKMQTQQHSIHVQAPTMSTSTSEVIEVQAKPQTIRTRDEIRKFTLYDRRRMTELDAGNVMPPIIIVDDIRFGVQRHDVLRRSAKEQDEMALTFEARFRPFNFLNAGAQSYGSGFNPVPKLHLGTAFHMTGSTSHIYTGFTWTADFHPRIFADFSAGLAMHNGHEDYPAPNREAFGSPVLVRTAIDLGFRFDRRVALVASFNQINDISGDFFSTGIASAGLNMEYRF